MGILVFEMCHRILAGRYLAEHTCTYKLAGCKFRLFSYYNELGRPSAGVHANPLRWHSSDRLDTRPLRRDGVSRAPQMRVLEQHAAQILFATQCSERAVAAALLGRAGLRRDIGCIPRARSHNVQLRFGTFGQLLAMWSGLLAKAAAIPSCCP